MAKFILLTSLLVIVLTGGFFYFQKDTTGLTALISGDTRIPYKPYGLQSVISEYNKVVISWTDDPSNTATGITVKEFKLSRRQAYTGQWTIVSAGSLNSSYTANVPPGSYDYKLSACNDNGCSPDSDILTVTLSPDTTLPSKPENFSVPQKEATDTKANLYWGPSTDDTGIKFYNIYRSAGSSSNFSRIASTSGTSYIDTALSPITNYYYQVKAVDYAKNESPANSIASIVTLALADTSSYLRVVSPNGGECFTLPGNLHVVWTGANQAHAYFGSQRIFSGRDTVFDWYMTASVSANTTASIKVVAVDDNGVEGLSDTNDQPFSISLNCSKVTPPPGFVPALPTYLKAALVSETRNIKLTWVDNSANESEFRIFRHVLFDDKAKWLNIGKLGPNLSAYASYVDTNVPPGDYEYDINACNSTGCSEFSNKVQITAVSTLPGTTYAASELKDGDTISAGGSDDPDIYIINAQGYKRLFLNPAIFGFYGHLGGFQNVKNVAPSVRNSFKISGLFRNCETNDEKIYGVEVTGEDSGTLHWVNTSGDQAVQDDPDFFKKIFCINNNEFNWYSKGAPYTSVGQIPEYNR